MKKIIVDKAEGIAEVIDHILNEPDKEVTIVVPKESLLIKSVSNFRLLKREADSAGRAVTIESVDDTALAFAKDAGLSSGHPLWSPMKGSGSGVSDITAPSTNADARTEPKKDEPAASREEKMEKPRSHDEDSYEDDDEDSSGRKLFSPRVFAFVGVIVAVIVIGFYVVGAFFNHADVTIDFKKTPWSFENNFVADKAASGINGATSVIPAQIFTADKNITQMFPASASADSSVKAQGTITIFNTYSTASQDLVATTRFVTPDGKIFRITQDVTVPGAKSANGTLTPSSINVPIIADQGGTSYNIGPVAHLSIPGFQGSPKFNGFYGAITASTTGGFVGKHAVPTAADIASAKTKTTQVLQSSLQGGFSGTYPNNFKILDGATSIQVAKLTVNTTTDANGNFSVFGEATLSAIGFDESALKTYLLSLAQNQEQNSVFNALDLSYTNVKSNFAKGQVTFSLSAQGMLEPAFSADAFTTSILGKSISDARTTIATLPNLADGKISVWPFWLWSIPSSAGKVHVTAN